jgi:hypothetical protein
VRVSRHAVELVRELADEFCRCRSDALGRERAYLVCDRVESVGVKFTNGGSRVIHGATSDR